MKDPAPPAARAFRHGRSRLVAASGAPNHRGRDALVVVGEPQVAEFKLAYGFIDKDLKDEDVAVELHDGGAILTLATLATSRDAPDDDGGRIRYTFPAGRELPPGRHRLIATVLGDGTQAELAIVVVPPGSGAFVSDIDGTLTVSEVAEFPALAAGRRPRCSSGSPRAASCRST
jgi:phosphatidate phosphatase PAH1